MNNRLTITNKKNRRKQMNIALTVIISALLIAISILLYKPNNKGVSKPTTTTTTTSEVVTTVTTTTEVVNNYTKVFVYNYELKDNNYKLYVCNGENYARISGYTLLNGNNILGNATTTEGVLVDKNVIDLSNMKPLMIEVSEKKYSLKYNSKCN